MSEPFYNKGLRFECTRCNACCRFEPGYVFLSEHDIERLMAATGLKREEFLARYCREVPSGDGLMISLKEKPNYDCIFWDEGCTVYPYRPLQCRSYPFWGPNLTSRLAWDSLKGHCPGVGKGKLHTQEEIESWLASRKDDPLVILKKRKEPA